MILYAWYSSYADKNFGHVLYKNAEGMLIKVTEIVSHDYELPYGKWNDYVYVGEVIEFVSSNRINMIDQSLPLNTKTEILYTKALEGLANQKKCQEQFLKTNNCFCHTCPTKVFKN